MVHFCRSKREDYECFNMCTFYSSLGYRLVAKLLNKFKNFVFRFDWGYNRKAGSIFQTLDSNGSPLKTKS